MDDQHESDEVPLPTAEEVARQIQALQAQWRRYGYEPIAIWCLQKAQQENQLADRMAYLQQLPWVNQRLAEWALADPDCPRIGRDALSVPRMNALLKATHDFVHNTAPRIMLDQLGLGGLRAIAFQQFAFQRSSPYALVRQFYLFHGLADNNKLSTATQLATGLTALELIVGSHVLASLHVSRPSQPVTLDAAVQAHPWFPRKTFGQLLAVVSRSPGELREAFLARPERMIATHAAMFRPAFELHPLMQARNKVHHAWNQACLMTALGGLLVRVLRDSGRADLVSQFGKHFEKYYVGVAVRCLGGEVFSEEDLKPFVAGRPVVDFLAKWRDGMVFFESKVREADEAVQGGTNAAMIGDRLKTSTIKAIEQAQSVAADAVRGTFDSLGVDGQTEKFLVIVVPDQHYMGTGEGIASYTGKERVDAIVQQYGGTPPVPLENIILLSADGLDALVARVERGDFTVLEFLRKFRDDQKDVQTRVMIPEQALLNQNEAPLPSYLAEADEAWKQLAVNVYGGGT